MCAEPHDIAGHQGKQACSASVKTSRIPALLRVSRYMHNILYCILYNYSRAYEIFCSLLITFQQLSDHLNRAGKYVLDVHPLRSLVVVTGLTDNSIDEGFKLLALMLDHSRGQLKSYFQGTSGLSFRDCS